MGGLTSALALAKAGFKDIKVYEAASDLGFVGAGIQLAPNMARVLDKLGVWKNIAKEAVVIKSTSIRRKWISDIYGKLLYISDLIAKQKAQQGKNLPMSNLTISSRHTSMPIWWDTATISPTQYTMDANARRAFNSSFEHRPKGSTRSGRSHRLLQFLVMVKHL